MYPEENTNWGYAAYRYGSLLSTGPNPIPLAVIEEATEIRWLEVNPETIEYFEDRDIPEGS